jgi:hypothetical protein
MEQRLSAQNDPKAAHQSIGLDLAGGLLQWPRDMMDMAAIELSPWRLCVQTVSLGKKMLQRPSPCLEDL